VAKASTAGRVKKKTAPSKRAKKGAVPRSKPPAAPSAELRELDLGNGFWLVHAPLGELRESDLNAHVMPKAKFERMVANIKQRGGLEGEFPYCAQPAGDGLITIVSGHHRIRALRAAGILEAWVVVDRAEMTRSELIAKQLAHNFLVGYDDEDLVRELLGRIDNPEDLIASGADETLLTAPEGDGGTLLMPRAEFSWKTITFTFLPHQLEALEELLEALDGQQELVVVAPVEAFEEFVSACAQYARVRKILSGGTAVAKLTEVALAEVRAAEDGKDDG